MAIKPNPDILDAMELWQLRAFEQGDEATGTMLADIREGYQAGYVDHGNASVAIAGARMRLAGGSGEPECVTCIVNHPYGCHRHGPGDPS